MAVAKAKVKKSSLAKRNVEKLLRNKLAVIGFAIVVLMILACLFAPLLTQFLPDQSDLTSRGDAPSMQHILGTDRLGRDVFARLLYGGRISILIGLSGAIGGMVIGVVLGSICGYFGGWIDKLLVKLAELVSSIPQLLLVLVLVVIAGQGTWNLIGVFVATGWIATFRLVRGRFFSIREENYVDACRAFGIGSGSIMFRHILPNCLGPVVVQMTLNTAGFIIQEAGLSYLGLGVPSSIATWGNIINAAKDVSAVTNTPWLWLAPGLTISLFVLGVNFLGDGLRDVLDPNQ